MNDKFDVCIRGAGVVGQVLALLLARERLRVALVEHPTPEPGALADVRAYALNAASRWLLQDLRVWPEAGDVAAVTPVLAMHIHDSAASAAASLRFGAEGDTGAQPLAWMVDVPALLQRLREATAYQSAIARLAAPPDVAPPLTVLCEGKHSSSRDVFGFVYDTQPYPQTALATRLRTTLPHGGVARQWFAEGAVMAWLPLGAAHGDEVALVWSLPHEQAARWQNAPDGELAAAVAAAGQHSLGDMAICGARATWPLTLARARRWLAVGPGGAVVLAGDAAHAMHPLAGQGLNVGLADAAELATVLGQREPWRSVSDWRLLRRYERARQAGAWVVSQATDVLFSAFLQRDERWQALLHTGLKVFDRAAPLKRWVVQQAAGATS